MAMIENDAGDAVMQRHSGTETFSNSTFIFNEQSSQ